MIFFIKVFIVSLACVGIFACLNDGDGESTPTTISSSSSSLPISSAEIAASSSSVFIPAAVLDSMNALHVGECFTIQRTAFEEGSCNCSGSSGLPVCLIPCTITRTYTQSYYYSEADSLVDLEDSLFLKSAVDSNAIYKSLTLDSTSIFKHSCDTTKLLNVKAIANYTLLSDVLIPDVEELLYDNEDSLFSFIPQANILPGSSYVTPAYFRPDQLISSISGKKLYKYNWHLASGDSIIVISSTSYLLEGKGVIYLHDIRTENDSISSEFICYTADITLRSEFCALMDSVPDGLHCE